MDQMPLSRPPTVTFAPVDQPVPADFRFGAHYGLKSDIAPCPKSADFVAKVFFD
jgi:hypothetical protein